MDVLYQIHDDVYGHSCARVCVYCESPVQWRGGLLEHICVRASGGDGWSATLMYGLATGSDVVVRTAARTARV